MLGKNLSNYLLYNGASQVGFADLSNLATDNMKSGVSIFIKIPVEIIKSINNGPNIDYYNEYLSLNQRLNLLAQLGSEFIRAKGFQAIAQTTDYVTEHGNYRTKLPHKTVATLSGLGWIGKSALFVTKEFGSAIRLTSIITNVELDYGTPTIKTLCGNCNRCVIECPGKAISGKAWNSSVDRDELFNAVKCRKSARMLSKKRFNKEITLCGKCIEVCPYTQGYISRDTIND